MMINNKEGSILPKVVVHNSITRKSGDYFWQYASNYHVSIL